MSDPLQPEPVMVASFFYREAAFLESLFISRGFCAFLVRNDDEEEYSLYYNPMTRLDLAYGYGVVQGFIAGKDSTYEIDTSRYVEDAEAQSFTSGIVDGNAVASILDTTEYIPMTLQEFRSRARTAFSGHRLRMNVKNFYKGKSTDTDIISRRMLSRFVKIRRILKPLLEEEEKMTVLGAKDYNVVTVRMKMGRAKLARSLLNGVADDWKDL